MRNDLITCLLQKRQEHDIRELNRSMNEFRYLHQQPAQRREWDLYDPEGLKKDKPARVSDDDPRNTISGLQKFDGKENKSNFFCIHLNTITYTIHIIHLFQVKT